MSRETGLRPANYLLTGPHGPWQLPSLDSATGRVSISGGRIVAKPEWGKKHTCPSCNTKFYDLRRSPIICPNCGAKVDPDAGTSGRKGRGGSRAPAAAAPKPEANLEEETPEVEEVAVDDDTVETEESEDNEEQDDYGGVIEDTSELGEESAFASVVGEDDEESS
jgi:uncharacterized protein (TIGR02300 family)